MEFRVLTRSRTNRAEQWIPLVLVFIGSLALVSGLLVAVLTMTRTTEDDRGIQEPRHGVIYIGANTCFTCHKDQDHNWALLDNAQTIAHTVTPPVDVALNQSIPQLAPVPILEAATQPSAQNYIIATENDQVRRAEQWNVDHLKSKPRGWTTECADCHTKPTSTGKNAAPADWRAQFG